MQENKQILLFQVNSGQVYFWTHCLEFWATKWNGLYGLQRFCIATFNAAEEVLKNLCKQDFNEVVEFVAFMTNQLCLLYAISVELVSADVIGVDGHEWRLLVVGAGAVAAAVAVLVLNDKRAKLHVSLYAAALTWNKVKYITVWSWVCKMFAEYVL